jgi:hypothetical protein
MRTTLRILAVTLLLTGPLAAADGQWQAGFAKVVITPDELMWMSGYGNRTAPAEGKLHDLYARAAALRHGKTTLVFVATDLVGVPPTMSRVVCEHAEKKHNLPRENVMLTCSHTHCGPALDDRVSHMLAMDADDWKQVKDYQQSLNAKLIELVDAAVADLKPARVAIGRGGCGFATNRRAPIGEGPVDHTVPVLAAFDPDGKEGTSKSPRGVIFGYACHNTTLSFQQWCGDYAGFAALDLEERHPGATALFFTGCGADANPLPRRDLELVRMYGRMLALAVGEVLGGTMTPLDPPGHAGFTTVELPFAEVPTKEQLTQALDDPNRFNQARARFLLDESEQLGRVRDSYPVPVQVWRFGNLTWVALGGEVVVDYAIRLKRELPGTVWVTGYANDVMAYIPSERVLKEGGYEGASSMVYYQMPSAWQSGLEQELIDAVHALTKPPAGEE